MILTGESISDMIDHHADLRLLEVVPAHEAGLLGQEARDCHGLTDRLAIVLQQGQTPEQGVCKKRHKFGGFAHLENNGWLLGFKAGHSPN